MKLSKNFTAGELSCRCGCGARPTRDLVRLLQRLRDELGRPLVVTSGARCERHNRAVGGARYSKHVTGEAVDLSCQDGVLRYALVQKALELGFTGVGVAKDFVHLDIRDESAVCWLY